MSHRKRPGAPEMKVFGFIDTISLFHYRMVQGATGNADCFSRRLGVSRSTLFNIIRELRDTYGIEIGYSRSRETFFYRDPESVEISLVIRLRQRGA